MTIRATSKIFGFTFAAFVLHAACSSGGAGLSEKKYPEGYSLKQPAGWMGKVVEKAYILVSSPEAAKEPAFLLVYPFFLETATPAGLWLDQNLANLGEFFPAAAIEKRQQLRAMPDEWAVKFNFNKGGTAYMGLALCSIFEQSGILYVVAARSDSFEKNRNSLLAMLKSFRFGEPESGRGPAAPQFQYVRFTDPSEQAFSLDVPQGWQVQGGTNRRAATDLVHSFQAISPDQRIVIQYNDPSIPAFTLPNQMLAFAGLQEGSWYDSGYGVKLLINRYLPGGQFLAGYLQKNYAPRVEQFEFVSQNDRPDLAEDFNRIVASAQAYGVQVSEHVGEADFRLRRNGELYAGYGLAITMLSYVQASQASVWLVDKLLIYTGPESQADLAQGIYSHMLKTLQWNPQWLEAQSRTTMDVSRIVTQTNQVITKIISDVHTNRQNTLDRTNRAFSNATLGVTDVVDPETGRTWKVEAGHNYYWAKPGGDAVVGTNTFTRPDIDFTPLKELR
jgi:hypothetical protein